MKQIPVSEFKKFKADQIKDNGCMELTSDGTPIAIVVVGAVGDMAQQIKSRCSMIDASRGKQ
jgi:hypothetical protein